MSSVSLLGEKMFLNVSHARSRAIESLFCCILSLVCRSVKGIDSGAKQDSDSIEVGYCSLNRTGTMKGRKGH